MTARVDADYVTEAARQLHRYSGGQAIVTIITPDAEAPATAMIANAAGLAAMLRHACQSVVENYPRPDDCDHCAAAWDRIAAAARALLAPPEDIGAGHG